MTESGKPRRPGPRPRNSQSGPAWMNGGWDVSSARSRELGARLRSARQTLGVSANKVAAEIGWSQAKESRLETGNRTADPLDVAYLLGYCHLPVEERDAILGLMDSRNESYWVRPHGGLLPEAVPSVVFQQNDATSITCYDPCGLPAMLQTAEYAEAELLPRFASSGEAMPHLRARLDRHGMLHRIAGPLTEFYLHESALRAMPVDAEVRAGQLLVLLMLIGREVRIRVIPADREHRRLAVGAFQVVRFAEFPPVVCAPTQTATLVLEGEADLEAYGAVLAELDTVALSTRDSTALINALVSEAQQAAPLVGATEDEDELEALIAAQDAREHMREVG